IKGQDMDLTVRNFDVHEAIVVQYDGKAPDLKEACSGEIMVPG
ncbi:unnamed protein product, partial [marine sediment metagenome]